MQSSMHAGGHTIKFYSWSGMRRMQMLHCLLFRCDLYIWYLLFFQFPVSDTKQKHLGCKKMQGQSEATLQTGRHDQKV